MAQFPGRYLIAPPNAPLQYSTVSLIDKQTEKTVNGSIADEKGSFEIRNIPYGNYKITVGFIGYQKRYNR